MDGLWRLFITWWTRGVIATVEVSDVEGTSGERD